MRGENAERARSLRVAVETLGRDEGVLDPATSHYVLRVHRLRAGDSFIVFDPKARLEADASLIDERAAGARFRVGVPRAARVSPLAVTLFQAFGKADKPDQVVRDATALGATRIVIVETEHGVVRLGERAAERLRRWQKIAVEAMRQSGRGDLPEISGPTELAQALKDAPPGLRLTLHPFAEQSFGELLTSWKPEQPLSLLIGPEGGLAERELALAEDRGFVRARLGPFTLRTETAAVAALGALLGR